MKIKTVQSVEGEFEVEVDISDVIEELANRVDEADPGRWRVFVAPLEALVKLVERIDKQTVDAIPFGVRGTIRERLSELMRRFEHEQTN